MKSSPDIDHDDLLERAIDSFMNEPFPAEPPQDQVRELVATVRQAADQPHSFTLVERIKNMKTTTKIAIAASVLFMLSGFVAWLAPGDGTVMAFEDVAEVLRNIRSASWKKTAVVKGPNDKNIEWTAIGMYLAPSHERTEISAAGHQAAFIVDGRNDHALSLDVTGKTATVIQLKNLPADSPFGQSFQNLRKLIVYAQSGDDSSVERLEDETIDGRRVGGFRIRTGSIVIKIWADPETSLPVRVEYASTAEPKVREVLTDFQINVNLDESLFSLDVPKGYTVEQVKLDLAKRPIEYLAEALRMAAEHNGNVFPSALRGKEGIDGVLQQAAGKLAEAPGKTQAERRQVAADVGMKLGGAFGVLFSISPNHDLHYVGNEVKLDTPNRPILWFRVQPKEASKYYVLYADLSFKEVAPEDIPTEQADN
jgi:outer membrane lipoprotein-sorting protein